MFEHGTLQNLNDFFKELRQRPGQTVYFYRICGYNEAVKAFIAKYYETARLSGVIIEGKIPNPDERQLSYYEEIMGLDFRFEPGFFINSLKRWLPRMNESQCRALAQALYDTLGVMQKQGKNANMLRNAYIKFMCWLYYKFERILSGLGRQQVPKLLYEGTPGNYELKLLCILVKAGCDLVMLQYQGDQEYRRLDPRSEWSHSLEMEGLGPFPDGFCIKKIRGELEMQARTERLCGGKPQISACTNTWIKGKGKGISDLLKGMGLRGKEPGIFYNCFYRILGVEDKLTFPGELVQFRRDLMETGRKMAIAEGRIEPPSMEEIAAISRQNYADTETMLLGLSKNIRFPANQELQALMVKVFLDLMMEEARLPDTNRNRLMNRAVYLLCWLKRYQAELFAGWRMPNVAVFVYLGGCKNDSEALFLRLLSRLPVDVLILVPDMASWCCLNDPALREFQYNDSLVLEQYPMERNGIRMVTAAYQAERELDQIMYQDSGLYRNQQYQKAVAVNLQTMYEEIAILWKQELKYRPNFTTAGAAVQLPVIFAKVSGVKNGQVPAYWSEIKTLMTQDTYVITRAPFIRREAPNPVRAHAAEFFKNGRLQREKIKAHPCYAYGYLRGEMQEYILDKIQLLIEQRMIRGTFENGTEYTIIATALNLNKDLVRMLQKFDFTKKNPKLLYICTTEETPSLEDAILAAFLNLTGFDVVFYVPTGYQIVEKYYNRQMLEEHQIGDYIYDLQTPDFRYISANTRPSWRDKLFRRGG